MASTSLSRIRNLQRRHARRRESLAVIEGVRLVEEALVAGVTIRDVVWTSSLGRSDRGRRLLDALAEAGVEAEEVAERALAAVADTETPQGILALVQPPVWVAADVAPGPGRPALILDGVRNPGNAGALLRTAWALGAAGAVLLPGTAGLRHPKVLRAAMGATFYLPAVPLDDDALLAWAGRRECELWVAAPDGTPIREIEARAPVGLVIGNEGDGVRPALRNQADRVVSVPMGGGAESLNVAVAAGILLYEVIRD